MNEYTFISKSPEETVTFAETLASFLEKKDLLVLSGELGAGKTKFTQGILRHFDLENEIASPTFTIVNEYYSNQTPIYHFDVYRLSDSSEFYEIGGDEYFEKGICLLEWGETIVDVLPKDYLTIIFEKDTKQENTRILHLYPHGEKYKTLLQNHQQELKLIIY